MSIRTEAEFGEMYRVTFDHVLAFVRRRAHPLVADDVVSETYLIAWRRRDEIPREYRPWLFGVARNQMLNAGRTEQRQRAIAVQLAPGLRDAVTEDHGDRLARQDVIRQGWARLTAAEQETLALTLFEDLNAAQAAQVLRCSRAAYAMRLSRARARFAALLHAADPQPGPTRSDSLSTTGGARP
jgi:RNA polymerase sigma factor (sigma-70 family)